MINLLPIEERSQLRSSFYNTTLKRLIFVFLISLMAIISNTVFIYFMLSQEKDNLNAQINQNQQKTVDFDDTKQKSTKIVKELASAEKIFKQQKHYSNFLIMFAQSLPNDISIDSLSISPSLFKKPAKIMIDTDSHDKVINTKRQLEKSSLISSVSIETVTASKEDDNLLGVFSIKFDPKGVEKAIEWRD